MRKTKKSRGSQNDLDYVVIAYKNQILIKITLIFKTI